MADLETLFMSTSVRKGFCRFVSGFCFGSELSPVHVMIIMGDFLGKNRDGLTIVAAIVEAAGSGSTKTRIMISANLSFRLLEKYLDVAVQAGFVSASNSKYHLTDSGREFILNYRSSP